MRYLLTPLAVLLALLSASPAPAYLPALAEIYRQIHAQLGRPEAFVFTSRSRVFTMAPPTGESGGVTAAENPDAALVVEERPERTFRQRVSWVAGGPVAVETFSDQNELLHLYLEEEGRVRTANLQPFRHFTEMDVEVPYLHFLERDPQNWLKAMTYWGVVPDRVGLASAYKGAVHYLLVDHTGNEAWIDQRELRPVRLRTRVETRGEPVWLGIAFSDFLIFRDRGSQQKWDFPSTTHFYLDGQLFKVSRVIDVNSNPKRDAMPFDRIRAELDRQEALEARFTPVPFAQ